jgi:hypothetical protein
VQREFRVAPTPVEKRLHRILMHDLFEDNMRQCIFEAPWCDKTKDNYDELLTKDLREAIAAAQVEAMGGGRMKLGT